MATLRLKEFRCVEETDETGSDSPYFLVFHGRTEAPEDAQVTGVRFSSWDNEIDSGDFRTVEKTVATDVGPTSVAVVALLEEDDDADFINSSEYAAMRNRMIELFEHYVAETTDTKWLGYTMAAAFYWTYEDHVDDDDFVDAKRIRLTTFDGPLPLLHMDGDGAYYRVRFVTSS